MLLLLAQAQVHLDPLAAARRVPTVAAEYAEDPSLQLWGVCRVSDGTVVGLVGVELVDAGSAVIRDLAVVTDRQGQGLGRALVTYAKERFGVVTGDTVEEAAPAYEHWGFSLHRAGTLPDGRPVLRFRWPPVAAGGGPSTVL